MVAEAREWFADMSQKEQVVFTQRALTGLGYYDGPITGETLEMTVVASRDAYLYCYYSDGRGTVARVFPNRSQPDPYVAAGRAVRIPGEGAGFDIVLERAGVSEEVACLAAQRELGLRLPQELKTDDLALMPIASLDEVVSTFEAIDGRALAEARLPIRVAR